MIFYGVEREQSNAAYQKNELIGQLRPCADQIHRENGRIRDAERRAARRRNAEHRESEHTRNVEEHALRCNNPSYRESGQLQDGEWRALQRENVGDKVNKFAARKSALWNAPILSTGKESGYVTTEGNL